MGSQPAPRPRLPAGGDVLLLVVPAARRRGGRSLLDAVTILTTISEIVGSGQALRPNKPERDLPPPYEEPPSYNVAIMMT